MQDKYLEMYTKKLWEEKQKLFKAFVDSLEYDLYVSHK